MSTTDGNVGGHSVIECGGCRAVIIDRFFLKAADRMWHAHCLKCWICHTELQGQLSCYTRDGVVYCRDDYQRLFGRKCCIRCGLKITNDELVMRVKDLVFHVTCFCCVQCGRLLNTGEYFGLKGLLPFCQDDLIKNPIGMGVPLAPHLMHHHSHPTLMTPEEVIFNMTHHHSVHPQPSLTPSATPSSQSALQPPLPPLSTSSSSVADQNASQVTTMSIPTAHHHNPFLFHPLSRLNNFYPNPHEPHSFHSIIPKVRGKKKRKDSMYESSEDFCMGSGSRQKRMRTSFKHHQLRAMKSYFALNHNPDAKDLKSLSEKTGLSKRVLQVWFQNARAKYRRNVSRNDGNSHDSFKDAKSLTGAGDDSEQGTQFSREEGQTELEDIEYIEEEDEDDDGEDGDDGDEDDIDDADDGEEDDGEEGSMELRRSRAADEGELDSVSSRGRKTTECARYLTTGNNINNNNNLEIGGSGCLANKVGSGTDCSGLYDNFDPHTGVPKDFRALVNDLEQNVAGISAASTIYASL